MSQKILVRRGTEAERLLIGTAPAVGEILYTTDRYELFIGDGALTGAQPLNYIMSANPDLVDQTITGNIGITGNLTVEGTMTTTTSNNVIIGDSIITLNDASEDIQLTDAGFEVGRGLQTTTSILWIEDTDDWRLTDTTGTRRILDTADIKTSSDFTLDGLGDTVITTVGDDEILVRSGTDWINQTKAEAGIQPLDGDLTAIAALAGTAGLLKKTAVDTWELDTAAYSITTGTVESVAAITLTTTGTDISSTVATGTTDAVITLNVPSSSAANRGLLTSADWSDFNQKVDSVGAGAGLTDSGTADAPILDINVDNVTLEVATDVLKIKANAINENELNSGLAGADGEVLTSDGLGGLSWSSASAGNVSTTITTGTRADAAYPLDLDGGGTYSILMSDTSNAGLMTSTQFDSLATLVTTDADKYTSWTIAADSGTEAVLSGQSLTIAGGGDTTTAYDAGTNVLTISTSAETTFVGLTDTPNDYSTITASTNSGIVALNTAGDALVYIDTIDGGTF